MTIQQILSLKEEVMFRAGGLRLRISATLLERTIKGQPAFAVALQSSINEGVTWEYLRRVDTPLLEDQLDSLYDTYGIQWYSDRVFVSATHGRREDYLRSGMKKG